MHIFSYVGENQLYSVLLILFVGENQPIDHAINLDKKGDYFKNSF